MLENYVRKQILVKLKQKKSMHERINIHEVAAYARTSMGKTNTDVSANLKKFLQTF